MPKPLRPLQYHSHHPRDNWYDSQRILGRADVGYLPRRTWWSSWIYREGVLSLVSDVRKHLWYFHGPFSWRLLGVLWFAFLLVSVPLTDIIRQLYRLFIIYGSSYAMIILPALVWLAGLGTDYFSFVNLSHRWLPPPALAFIQLYLSGKPNGNLLQGRAQEFGIAYYTITIAFNVVLTPLIIFRLHKMGKVLSSQLGHERSSVYTGLQALLVESAAPFSSIGFMFLIPYAIEAPTAIAFGQIWGKMAVSGAVKHLDLVG